MTELPATPVEASEPIVTFNLQQKDFTSAILRQWDASAGDSSIRQFVLALTVTLAFATTTIFLLLRDGMAFHVGLAAFFAGMGTQLSIGLNATRKLRLRQAAQMWETSYSRVPSPLTIWKRPDGIRFTGTKYDQTFAWLDIDQLVMTNGRKIWIARTKSFAMLWAPSSAFSDKAAFERFADWAWDEWKANRPTTKGFEVQLLNQQDPTQM